MSLTRLAGVEVDRGLDLALPLGVGAGRAVLSVHDGLGGSIIIAAALLGAADGGREERRETWCE